MNTTGKVAKTNVAAQPAVAIIVKLKDIQAKTAELKTRGELLQTDTHILACSVMAHVSKHGNINVLLQFLDAVPDMVRSNALQAWFEHFGQVTYSALNEGEDAMWRIDRTKKIRLGDAMVKPFWKFKAHEGMPYQPIDMAKWCETQIKALKKDAEKTGVSHAHLITFLQTYNPQSELGSGTHNPAQPNGNGHTAH